MNRQQPEPGYRVEYAMEDAIVKRFLERAGLYKGLGWFQLALCIIVAAVGVFDRSISAATTASLMGVTAAFCFIAQSGHQKSAWLRTLEVRLEDLRKSTCELREPTHSEDVPVA